MSKIDTSTSAAPVATPELKVGDVVRLTAAHGYIQHPFELTGFHTDRETKTVVDSWVLIQFTAGKLTLAKD